MWESTAEFKKVQKDNFATARDRRCCRNLSKQSGTARSSRVTVRTILHGNTRQSCSQNKKHLSCLLATVFICSLSRLWICYGSTRYLTAIFSFPIADHRPVNSKYRVGGVSERWSLTSSWTRPRSDFGSLRTQSYQPVVFLMNLEPELQWYIFQLVLDMRIFLLQFVGPLNMYFRFRYRVRTAQVASSTQRLPRIFYLALFQRGRSLVEGEDAFELDVENSRLHYIAHAEL